MGDLLSKATTNGIPSTAGMHITDLPPVIFIDILQYLNRDSRLALSQICKILRIATYHPYLLGRVVDLTRLPIREVDLNAAKSFDMRNITRLTLLGDTVSRAQVRNVI